MIVQRFEEPAEAAGAQARCLPGLPEAIDAVAAAAPATHHFLRRQWYAAAVAAYGGAARTIVATEGAAVPSVALPLVAAGPRRARLAMVPGCYWPFRAPVMAQAASDAAIDALLVVAAREVRALRIGPVADDDAVMVRLLARARAGGWATISRIVGTGYRLDMVAARAAGTWPRSSTLKKNRFHEKHLAAHGALDWRFVTGAGWPEAFDAMAQVEKTSWLADRTDGRDTKFTAYGHGAFFRAAAQDPVLARMFHAAILTIDGVPSAFSFDLDVGTLKHAIANSYAPAVAKHSPGKLLYYRNLVQALERGVERVDWGMGDSGYKRVIGAREGAMLRDWVLVRPGLVARCLRAVRRRGD
ncbi:GNAT family N-acetyltransferase [Sphingomonas adhaesiva]|uniref:GNAT family N-acetyltransferase n=1 Tax=Sphingomonas adhaesiva TaxID=28212 RepID=UPI002FF903CA